MSTVIENLHMLRAQVDAMIAAVDADGSGSKLLSQMPKGSKAPKAPKAEKRANAGVATLHGAWTAHVLEAHGTKSTEYLEWLAARIASAKAGELLYTADQAKVKKGKKAVGDAMDEKEAAVAAHIPWVGYWRKEHPDAFEEFKNAWETANPKESRVASAKASQASGSDAEESEDGSKPAPKKRGAKKMADMTPEEQAAAKAKRAANKAAKAAKKAEMEEAEVDDFTMEVASSSQAIGGGGSVAAAAPMAEPAAEEEASGDSLIPFTHKKVKYLRFGHLDEDGEGVWDEGGDLWLATADGAKGAYAGQLQVSGKIDSSPTVMENEPEID